MFCTLGDAMLSGIFKRKGRHGELDCCEHGCISLGVIVLKSTTFKARYKATMLKKLVSCPDSRVSRGESHQPLHICLTNKLSEDLQSESPRHRGFLFKAAQIFVVNVSTVSVLEIPRSLADICQWSPHRQNSDLVCLRQLAFVNKKVGLFVPCATDTQNVTCCECVESVGFVTQS